MPNFEKDIKQSSSVIINSLSDTDFGLDKIKEILEKVTNSAGELESFDSEHKIIVANKNLIDKATELLSKIDSIDTDENSSAFKNFANDYINIRSQLTILLNEMTPVLKKHEKRKSNITITIAIDPSLEKDNDEQNTIDAKSSNSSPTVEVSTDPNEFDFDRIQTRPRKGS